MVVMLYAFPEAVRLALSIIKTNFGDVNELVVRNLLERGPQTLKETVKNVEFPHISDSSPKEKTKETDRLVRASLMAMLQFQYVKTFVIYPEATARNPHPVPFHQYEADIAAIIRTLRVPYYFQFLRERHPPSKVEVKAEGGRSSSELQSVHEALLLVLVENGRLRLDQIISAVAAKRGLQDERAAAIVTPVFEALLRDRFVERAAPCNLPRPPPPRFPRRVGKPLAPARPGTERADQEQLEKQRQEPAELYAQNRYKLQAAIAEAPILGGQGASSAAKGKTQGQARKKAAAAPTERSKQQTAEEQIELWQVSHSHFTRLFRYRRCAEFMFEQQGVQGGTLVRAMLRAALPQPVLAPANEEWSPAVTATEIGTTLPLLHGVPDDFEAPLDVREAILEMVQEDPDLVREDSVRGEAAFCLNLAKIVEHSKLLELQSCIKGRFGREGVMVWNAVLDGKQMQSKTIHETVLLSHNSVRKALYSMMRADFLFQQDIPKTTDHAPANTFHTFKVSLPAAQRQLLVNMLKGASNLVDRMEFELNQRPDVVLAMSTKDWSAFRGREGEIRKVQSIFDFLERSLLAVAPTLALFTDF